MIIEPSLNNIESALALKPESFSDFTRRPGRNVVAFVKNGQRSVERLTTDIADEQLSKYLSEHAIALRLLQVNGHKEYALMHIHGRRPGLPYFESYNNGIWVGARSGYQNPENLIGHLKTVFRL